MTTDKLVPREYAFWPDSDAPAPLGLLYCEGPDGSHSTHFCEAGWLRLLIAANGLPGGLDLTGNPAILPIHLRGWPDEWADKAEQNAGQLDDLAIEVAEDGWPTVHATVCEALRQVRGE